MLKSIVDNNVPKKEAISHVYTDEDIQFLLQELWLTVVSSPRSLTAEGIENHFRNDTGASLEELSRSLGYHTIDGLLRSENCSNFIIQEISKDELEEFGHIRYSAISIDDITHITNNISESRLHEDQLEMRKEFHKKAKYSTEEFHEKSLIMREKIVRIAHELISENADDKDYTAWQSIQTRYEKVHNIPLNKKHLRSAFPTGHASAVLEKYMFEEFEIFIPSGLTGNMMIKLKKSIDDIIKMYNEARIERDKLGDKLKNPQFRVAENEYVDYVREREKKELFLARQKSKEQAANKEDQNQKSKQKIQNDKNNKIKFNC